MYFDVLGIPTIHSYRNRLKNIHSLESEKSTLFQTSVDMPMFRNSWQRKSGCRVIHSYVTKISVKCICFNRNISLAFLTIQLIYLIGDLVPIVQGTNQWPCAKENWHKRRSRDPILWNFTLNWIGEKIFVILCAPAMCDSELNGNSLIISHWNNYALTCILCNKHSKIRWKQQIIQCYVRTVHF